MCQRLILNAQIKRIVMRQEDGKLLSINPKELPDDVSVMNQ